VAGYSWLCANELDRERLIGTVKGLGRARVVMFAVLLLGMIAASPQTGWWPIAALLFAAVTSIYLYRDLDRRSRPEYWAAAGWLATQVPLAVGIAITGGPRSPALSWLAIAVVSLVARFNRRAIRVGMVFLYLLFLVDTYGVNAGWAVAHSADVLGVAALMAAVWLFAEALMRSDLDHRARDATTGLPNMAKFLELLRLSLKRTEERSGAVAVMIVGLAGLDEVREALGPRAANGLLGQAGARIARSAATAELVASGSGDEFLILFTTFASAVRKAADPLAAVEAAARNLVEPLKAAIEEPFAIGNEEVCVGAHFGIALHGERGLRGDVAQAAERLLADAELALGGARDAGPGGVAVYDPAKPRAARRLSLVSRLRRAIEGGDLEVYYQPTVDIRSGEIIGVEALARWNDRELGPISPGEFIPIAEETGLIEPLGRVVLEEVARQTREWAQRGIGVEVAFNLSPYQLWHRDLHANLKRLLEAVDLPRDRFIIEITESGALRDFEATVRLLARLRSEGYRIAIDDFGVELSSLSRLLEIPSDILKIDRSFVQALSTQANAGVMVKTIIELAERLGLLSHAEGVEREEERRFLLASGCDLAQGYLFSRPVPPAEIERRYLESLYRWPVQLGGGRRRRAA